MTSTIHDIQTVLSLRKAIRESTVPPALLSYIETIHHSISSSAEQNGWKTVDWRGNRANMKQNTGNNHNHGNYSSNRPSHYGNRDSASYGYRARVQQDSATIPLTPSSASPSSSRQSGNDSHEPRRNAWHENSDGFRHAPQKYVSKFKKSSEKVEDTILNTILLGKLNKFSQPNYNEIKEFITHIIDSGQTEMIKCFMKLVFEKAASEEVFCPLYAKLLSELSALYPVLLTEMANLYAQYMEIFEEVEETSSTSYNELCKRNVEKKYRRGYSQFLAELIKHDVIDGETFMKIIDKIISQVELNHANKDYIKLNEEFADCLMKIMKAIYKDTSAVDSDEDDESEQNIRTIRKTLKTDVAVRIHPLSVRNSEAFGLSNKARFTFLDIYEEIQKF
jgi:hypothetical protein